MKRILYTTMLLIFAMAYANAETGYGDSYHHITGKWYNYDLDLKMMIQDYRRGFKAKVFGVTGWQKYRRVKENKYMTKRGDVLKIKGDGRLIYKSDCGRHKITFERRYIKVRPRCGVGLSYHSDDYHNNYHNGYEHRVDLEGRWYNESLGHELIVIKTRHGLKTRLDGDRKWTYYDETKRNARYRDKRGNELKISRNGKKLIWEGRNGRQFSLRKVSERPFD